MKYAIEKRFSRTILAASMAAIGFSAPLAAQAEDNDLHSLTRPSSEVEVGIGNVSDPSYKYGDYGRGLEESGTYLIGNASMNVRGDNNANYLELNVRNLGLSGSRDIVIKGGEQGNYGLSFSYDELSKLFSDSYQTPFVNPGSTNLTLPAGWVSNCATTAAPGTAVPCTTATAAASTALMTNLNASMQSFNVETMRKSYSFGVTKLLSAEWDATVNFKREDKDGNRFIGAVIGSSGGNPRAAVLPEPVNYTTDQFEALARYTGEKLQMQLGYYGSFFRNANSGLAWQNPYANGATTWGNAAVGYPNGSGQIGLPADNQFHQISATGGYSYSKDTRVSGNLSMGRMTQNEAFLPYSVNPGLTITTPMPRSSLDGKIDTTHVDMKLTSKLMPKLNLTAAYRYDDRDNKTPQTQYVYIGGDSTNQAVAGATDRTRTNLPGSSTKQQVDAELDYHMSGHTKLKLGYGYDWVKKTFEAIDSENEHTIKAGVDHRFGDTASGGLSYAYSDRRTSAYDASAPFLATYTGAAYIAGITTGLWDNVPTQKKFFLAPRQRDKLHAYANVAPSERVDLQFGLDYKNDDYHSSELGLREATGWAANFDANLVATDMVSGHLFASWEDYQSNQKSAQLGATKANYLIPGNHWTADITDRTLTLGAGFRVKQNDSLDWGGDLSHSSSNGQISVTPGALLAAAKPLPDIVSRLGRLELFGKYKMQKDLLLNIKYVYEQYNSADWAYDQVLSNTLANVIGTNQTSPDYRVHAIGASLIYNFK